MHKDAEGLLGQLAMLHMGNQGNTEAHLFLEDVARSPIANPTQCFYHRRVGMRQFIPPKPADRVVMFKDNSGVYIHSDGFCTPMGADISHEVSAWQEIKN